MTLAACSSGPASEDGRLERVLEDFQWSFELSEFEERVFADGVVTQAEYDEAYDRWRTCAEDRGLTVRVERDDFDLYVIVLSRPAETDEDDAMQDLDTSLECEKGNWILIEQVYRDQTLNPDSRNWYEGELECMVDSGLVDPEVSVDEYMTMQFPDTDEAWACYTNPFGVSEAS